MDTLKFLHFVITGKDRGWLNISASLPDGTGWRQYWRGWPDDDVSAVELIEGLKGEGLNVFYSAHLFSEKSTERKYVLDTRTLFADLDAAEPAFIKVRPTMLVRSSDHRWQAYWIINDWMSADELEAISKRVTWGIDKADHSGWYLGHIMRVPNTFNYKYQPQEKVRVYSYNDRTYSRAEFEVFPRIEVSGPLAILPDDEWIQNALKVPAGHKNVYELWDSIKGPLAKDVDVHMHVEAPDRSGALWRLMNECFRNAIPREQVFLFAYHSKNNKFANLRYGGLRELAKDVIRAERESLTGPEGMRSRMHEVRRLPGTLSERRQGLAEACRNQMLSHGRFVHARGNTFWYILDIDGKPVPVNMRSTQLNVIMDNMFGLNATEPEHQFTVASLINYTANLPQTGEIASLSHYIQSDNTLLIHTGQRNVLRITPDKIDTVNNGHRDVIFLWNNDNIITPDVEVSNTEDTWYEALFGLSLSQLTSDTVNSAQAMALLRAWFIMLLLRNAVRTKPILAIFGQPGSGKSTLFNRVFALIYGGHKAVSGVGKPEEFDHSMAVDPLVVLDNVDTWEKWLPDRIARAAGVSEISRRKLYTDTDTITIRTQAFLGITAHNPKFGREDVLDRFLLINLERVQDRQDETSIINGILSKRDRYWGQIARDVQKVLGQPEAHEHEIAQFRVQDYSKIGQRIANALEFGQDFYTAIMKMVDQQKGFVLDEDSVLVDVIADYIKSPRYKNEEYQTPAKLWGIFDILAGPDKGFGKQYGNSVKLGRKLWAMQDALKQRFVVEWEYDPKQKTRVWRFKERQTNG